jgi:aspartate aminotransferase-like enzyme
MIDHRGPFFRDIYDRVSVNLKQLFETQNDVLMLTSSGSGGLEAAVVNTLSPGEPVLAVEIGAFGVRLGRMAETFGADVRWQRVEWGQAATPESVAASLDANPDVTSVLITHNETSTGVTNPIGEIAQVVKQRDKLLIVDAVSSLGSLPCPVDNWGIDVVVTGSQKGWMAPPGLAMVSLSPRAWEAVEKSTMPKFYFDLKQARDYAARSQTPWTPAIPIFYALDASLTQLLDGGLPAIHARHQAAGDRIRAGVKSLGLSLFPEDESTASNTVTAIKCPDGFAVADIRKAAADMGVVLAGGQARLSDSIFRIGHLGYMPDEELDEALDVLGKALEQVGFAPAAATA